MAVMSAGRFPNDELMEAVALAVACVLLLTPGYVTDAVGFMLLVSRELRFRLIRFILELVLGLDFFDKLYDFRLRTAMILIRHGQTIFNVIFSVTRVDPGVPDPLLTSRGRSVRRGISRPLSPARVSSGSSRAPTGGRSRPPTRLRGRWAFR